MQLIYIGFVMATKAEKEHMAQVAQLPCIISGKQGVHIHHITHCGRRLGHFWVLPLHIDYHTGDKGLSGHKCEWDTSLQGQMELCRQVYKKLKKEMPKLESKIAGYWEKRGINE